MRRLTKYEKETILLTNELDDFWDIYTFNSALKRKLKKFASKYPELCYLREQTEEGSMTYRVKKDRVSVNLKKPVSDETRKKRSEAAKARGLGKSGDSEGHL